MVKRIEIKFLKNTEKMKIGETAEASLEDAKDYVEHGLAEYVNEPIPINEADIKKQIEFLDYKNEIEVRIFKADYMETMPDKPQHFCKNVDEVINVAKKYNGKFNIYIGLNERKIGGDNIESIEFIKNIYIDIDAHNSFTKENAKIAVDKILEDYKKEYSIEPLVIDSGHGYWIIFPIESIQNTEENRKKISVFAELIKSMYANKDVDVDVKVTKDVSRVGRLAGTLNLRNKDNPVLAKILNKDVIRVDNKKLADKILSIEISTLTKKEYEPLTDEKLIRIGKFFEKLRELDLSSGFEVYDIIQKNEASWCVETGKDMNKLKIIYQENGWNYENTLGRWYKSISEGKNIKLNIGELVNWIKEHKTKLENSNELLELLYDKQNVDDFLIIKTNKKGVEIGRSVDIEKVAEYIGNKFNIRTIYGIKEETIEVYTNGIWSVEGKGIIKGEAEILLKDYAKNNTIQEILEKIKRRTKTTRSITDIIPDKKRCLENGVLDLEDINDIKFIPHSRTYNFRTKFPIIYDINATCPNILKFINETFDEDDIPVVQEWFGFHIIRLYIYKKSMICYGPKDTGKSKILLLLTKFVGNNISGLSIQEIGRAKAFDLLDMKDKDANICDDLQSSDVNSVGGFKKAIGDAQLNGEQKGGERISFRNTAKNTNACNKIPAPNKDVNDEAFYDRLLLIPVDNVVPKEKQNSDLLNELTTPKELSGLLNWAIEGYIRLVKQNKFSYNKTAEENRQIMQRNGKNLLADFAQTILVQANGESISKECMYQIYCAWCNEQKMKIAPDSIEKIGRNLTKFAPYIQASQRNGERYWLNVKINTTSTTLYSIYGVFRNNININNNIKNNLKTIDKSGTSGIEEQSSSSVEQTESLGGDKDNIFAKDEGLDTW
ncbi:MAG: phage/plasmid primase, P4 family [Nanoarchaeota archaeon]|nr:phage/plasmid primase, P4 family [Nanoarchaeota archaeon]